jgi:CRISPR-associated endonuclease/helicase Cas3
MSTLLDRLLVWLKALGSSIIMLSATLPSGRRDAMLSAYAGHPTAAPVQPYPRITWVVDGIEGGSHFQSASSSGRPREVRLAWVKDEPGELAGTILSGIGEGGSVAVICNTVLKAQEIYAFLKDRLAGEGVDVDLFHARYPYGQRKTRQDRVLAHFGKGERDPAIKRVLVATQVIEQSLDLDFDLMITEMAPVDLILQRMGRLHRHHRERRPAALSDPMLLIMEPHKDSIELPDYRSSKFVYSEHILLRSQLSLMQMNVIRIPEDIERLVERVYSGSQIPTPSQAWDLALARSGEEQQAAMAEKESKGIARSIPLPSYDRPWDATRHLLEEDDPDVHKNLQAQTRDSPPSVSLICLYENEGLLSLDPEGLVVIDPSSEPSPSMIPGMLDRAVAISDPGWKRSPLLNHHKIAAFSKLFHSTDYCCPCGDRSLVLSDEVGVYTVDGEPFEVQSSR